MQNLWIIIHRHSDETFSRTYGQTIAHSIALKKLDTTTFTNRLSPHKLGTYSRKTSMSQCMSHRTK